MRRRVKLLLALGVVLVGGGVAFALKQHECEKRCGPDVPRIATSDEEARERVAHFLVSEGAPHNREGFLLARAGPRVIPFIVEAARCDRGCSKDVLFSLRTVLADMGPERAAAAPGLLAIAQDPAASDAKVAGALSVLGGLGADAASTEAALVALRARRPSMSAQIDDAFIAMHSRRSGAIFAERFGNQPPDIFQLRDLAEVGPAARDAGPAVVALLSSPESEIRLGAARTLGFIGYVPSVDALIALLDDPVDARVAWAAAESLGRLRDPRAISALERTAEAHWYPPVRETAASAAASLRNGTTFVGKQEDDDFQLRFIAVWNLGEGVANCSSPVDAPAADLRYRKLAIKKDKASITKLAYPARLTSDEDPPPSMRPELAAYYADIAATRARWLKTAPDVVPQVAMRVNDGWLAGSDRGEFGGELVFVGDGGTRRQLAEVNVKDLHVLGKRIVMLEGLAHGLGNEGAIHEIARAPDGTMRATPWRILPGAPRTSWITEHGELLIQLESAGTVLVSPDGNMRMAPCRGV